MRVFGTRHIVLVFVVGLVAGLALGVHYSRWHFARPGLGPDAGPRSEARFVERFSKELNLTVDQKAKLAAILERKRADLKSVRDTVDPKLAKIRRQTSAEIEKILTPDQVRLFRKHQHRFDRKPGPRGPGPASAKP